MSHEIKTRKIFSRFAEWPARDKRPAPAPPPRVTTLLPAALTEGLFTGRRKGLPGNLNARLVRLAAGRAFRTAGLPAVPGILAGSFAFSRVITRRMSFTCPPAAWRVTAFLIANPELEFRLTPFENRHLKISNRECMAVFRSAIVTSPGLGSCLPGNPDLRIGALALSPLVTSHSPLATAFLIYGPAIRIPRNSLKT
jgi:hypothetical protein